MRLGMISQSLIATVAKVVVIGGLMAGAAGGIYAVASTRGDDSSKQSVVAATATPKAGAVLATATSQTITPAPATPPSGLTDTGYKAPDGSPLYAECVGTNPVTGQKFQLPPTYPSPAPHAPLPSPAASQNTEPRPPDASLPAFDVLTVPPSDSTAWPRVSTPCLGGLSFATPPDWVAIDGFAVGSYQQSAGAEYQSPDRAVKVDITYRYSTDDSIARFRNRQAGNGTYLLASNVPVSVGGVQGLVDISSEAAESPQRYVAVAYLVSPRPNWYLSYVGFFSQPFGQASVADFLAVVNGTRFAP